MAIVLGAVVASYLVGSIPFGLLIARVAGVEDIRRHGSGNIGATNVLRTVGVPWALLVLALDAAKGVAGVELVRWAGGSLDWQALGGIVAMAGHTWPFALRFRGGRGVATGLGVLLALDPLAALVGAVVFVVTVASTRYVSLGSMLAAVPAVAVLGLHGGVPVEVALAALGAAVIIWRHRPNIERLLQGRESKFSLRPAARQATAGPDR